MEPGDCGCTGRRKTREMGGLSPRLADSLPASQARLVPLQGAGISRRPWVGPTPPPVPIAELRPCPPLTPAAVADCHRTRGSVATSRIKLAVSGRLGLSLRLTEESETASVVKRGQPLRTGPTRPLPGPQGKAFKRTLLGWVEEVGAGWGRCQKSETKNLRHDSNRGGGVARRPGAAAGSGLSTWHHPPSPRPVLGLVPQSPASPLLALQPLHREARSGVLGETDTDRQTHTRVRRPRGEVLSRGSGTGGNRPALPVSPGASLHGV